MRSHRLTRRHRLLRSTVLVLAACIVVASGGAAVAAPAGGRVHDGSSTTVGGGTARAYAVVDSNGEPSAVGIRMSATALDDLPGSDDMFMLHLPSEAADTVFDHVMLNWNPQGHEPKVLFGKPHFDVHFYMTAMASIERIDPSAPDYADRAAHLPDAKYMPPNYITPPGMLASQLAVPYMGVHWIDTTDGMISGVYDFTQTFVNGSWDGDYTFMEPMITREWLLTRPALREDIALPTAYQHTAYYPTVYSVRFDDRTQEFDIALEGMTLRHAS